MTWGGIVALLLLAAGTVRALRSGGGRAVVAAALTGTLGIELALLAVDHWSSGRYDLVAWPFVVVLLGLGVSAPLAFLRRPTAQVLSASLLAALIAAQLVGLLDVYRHGRPDWRRVAEIAVALHRPGQPLLATNDWTAICLGPYLAAAAEAKDPGSRPPAVITLDDDPDRARAARRDGHCAVVVSGGYPRDGLADWLRGARPARILRVGETRVHLLGPIGVPRLQTAPCLDRHLPRRLREPAPLFAWRPQAAPPERLRLDFDPATTAGALLGGWGGYSRRADGTTYSWVVGQRAAVSLHLDQARRLGLRIVLWPHPGHRGRQRVTLFLHGRRLASEPLRSGRQTLEVPAVDWRAGENILELRFTRKLVPAAHDPDSRDRRPLAAAVDRIELLDPAAVR